MGFIMFQDLIIFGSEILAAVMTAILAVTAVLLTIAILFFVAAVKSPEYKILLYIFSAVFGVPAVLSVQLIAGATVDLYLYDNIPLTAAVFAVLLALFIFGVKIRRVRFAFRLLPCIPWFALSVQTVYIMFTALLHDIYGFEVFAAISAVVTGGSVFLFYRGYRNSLKGTA